MKDNPQEWLILLAEIQKILHNNSNRLSNYADYASLKASSAPFLINLQQSAGGIELLRRALCYYVENSINTNHPNFANQLWSGQSPASQMGELISVLTNTSMATYETAPLATIIENNCLKVLMQIFGFDGGEAQMATGGSHGNMMAVMLARNEFFARVKKGGLFAHESVKILVSAESHYSFDKATNILGLGTDSLVKIATDNDGAMDLQALAQALTAHKGRVLMVVATAGTTVRGAFDDIDGAGQLARQAGVWFHVDGAWGGAVGLSPRHRFRLNGLNRADSFVFDGHKMLGLPLMCSFFFNRHLGLFDRHFTAGDTSYIFHNDDETQERTNLGSYSLLCGRKNDIIKFWAEVLYYGFDGLAARIDNLQDLAQFFAQKITSHPKFELQSRQIINNVCFRFVDSAIADLDEFNLELRNRLYHKNIGLINYATINGALTIRMVITSMYQSVQSLDALFDSIELEAELLLKERTDE